MNLIEATKTRHAVRHFDGKPLNDNDKKTLLDFIKEINKISGLNMQLVVGEPKAFGGAKAAKCNFTGCVNYIALIGPKSPKLQEMIGYYGEQVVLKAQQMGINSCWVVLTYDQIENTYIISPDQEILGVIAIGYGTTQGKPHPSKSFEDVVINKGNLPEWFKKGVEIALNAPTGVNNQGFKFELIGNDKVKITNSSFCKDIDVGIVKYHFELGAGKEGWHWSN